MFKIMMKGPPGNLGMLFVSIWLTFGCSAFHEVAVVSHGEEVAPVERVREIPPVLSEDISAIAPIEQEEEILLSPVMPIIKSNPTPPSVVLPSAKRSVEKEIFAQSAEDTTLPWTLQDVFFDFDQNAIRQDAISILEQNAKVLLKRYANREVLIQGHCDERGTEAYNFVLGARRATAVKNYLIDLGVSGSRVRVLSLGKSQPFCLQRTISCFQQNRRAHFSLN